MKTIDQMRGTMTTQQPFQLCSNVSEGNGEDPIGTAFTFEYCLAIEMPQPWSSQVWGGSQIPTRIRLALDKVSQLAVNLKVLALQPDDSYSRDGFTRVIRYRRPKGMFAQFEKLEYVVPTALAPALIEDMFDEPGILEPFAMYRQHTQDIRELFVCVHQSHDQCCGRFGYPIYKMLRSMHPLRPQAPFRVWRTSHIGGHRLAATLLDFPYGHYWGHLNRRFLTTLLEFRGSVEAIHPFYRGWAGLPDKFCQIAEREIWMSEGWQWLDYEKTGQVLNISPDEQSATVRIDFCSPDSQDRGHYLAEITKVGQVETKLSTDSEQLTTVSQYEVTSLKKVVELEPIPA